MSVDDFLKRHKDNPNSELDGKNVHPMVIEIPLDYIVRSSDPEARGKKRNTGKKCGYVILLPDEVLESSLGHKFQKFLDGVDLVSAHHKSLLLSEAGAFTEAHEDMMGSNLFYALLTGEKVFHVYYRNTAITKAIRSMTPEQFDRFLKTQKHAIVHLKAGQGMIMPGNLVHRVYTIKDSVAIGCNFISEPQMKNALLARQWEQMMVARESPFLFTTKFFYFDAIAAVFLFEKLQYHRLNISVNESIVKEHLKQLVKIFTEIMEKKRRVEVKSFLDRLQSQWIKPLTRKFDWCAVEEFARTDSFL